jgi:hypothetical protein
MRRFAPDALVLLGLAGVGYGFWLLHPSLTFLSVGGVMLYLGICLYRKRTPGQANKE